MKNLWFTLFLITFFSKAARSKNRVSPLIRRKTSISAGQEYANPWQDPEFRSTEKTVVDLALRKDIVGLKAALANGYDPRAKVRDKQGRDWTALHSSNPDVIRAMLASDASPTDVLNGQTLFRWHVDYYLWRATKCHIAQKRINNHREVICLLADKMPNREKKRELKAIKAVLKRKESTPERRSSLISEKDQGGEVAKQRSPQGLLKALSEKIVDDPSVCEYLLCICPV